MALIVLTWETNFEYYNNIHPTESMKRKSTSPIAPSSISCNDRSTYLEENSNVSTDKIFDSNVHHFVTPLFLIIKLPGKYRKAL